MTNSVFLEILFKTIKSKKKKPDNSISSEKILKKQMDKFGFKKKVKILNPDKLNDQKLNNKFINLIIVI